MRGPCHLGEERFVHVGELDHLHLHADALQAELLGKALAGIEGDGSETGGRRLGAGVAARLPRREDQSHLRAVVGEVLAQLLDVGAGDLARSAHELDGGAQVGDAAALPAEVERPFLAALGDAHVAHPHLLQELGAEPLETCRFEIGEAAAQRPQHGAPALGRELGGAHGATDAVRSAGLLEHRGGRRELDQGDAVAVDDEGRLAARFGTAAVVLEERLYERRGVAHQRVAEETLLEEGAAQFREGGSRLALREPFEGHLGRRRELAALATLVLLALLRTGLERLEAAAGLGVDRARLALAGAVERRCRILLGLERRSDRLDDLLGWHAPLEKRKGAVRRYRHHPALVLALGHRREALAHRHLGILPDVAQEVVAYGGFRDLRVMQGLVRAAQDFHRRFRERHVEPLQLPSGLKKLPLGRWKKRAILGAWIATVNALLPAAGAGFPAQVQAAGRSIRP